MAEAAAVPSPCVSVCVMDAAGELCLGCHRTLAEIAAWPDMSTAEKLAVIERAGVRRAAAHGQH